MMAATAVFVSSSVVVLPKLIRTTDRDSSSDSPMSLSTGLGTDLCEEQAEPADIMIPSADSALTRVSPLRPGVRIERMCGTVDAVQRDPIGSPAVKSSDSIC